MMNKHITQELYPEVRAKTREGVCPSCGAQTVFDFHGEQHWPKRLVEATGCPPTVLIWNCRRCKTTLSDLSIQ